MGMNYYLRAVKPVEVYPEFHVGKRSWGWKGLYQSHHQKTEIISEEVEKPYIDRLDDIRACVESGDYILVNEDGDQVTVDDFARIMDEPYPKEIENGIDRRSHLSADFYARVDRDGREWTETEFS